MKELIRQGNGRTSDASLRRKININFIKNLPLDGLLFSERECQLLLYETERGEKVYLQYPGKESRRDTRPNERDFRPKLYINGEQQRDLNFGSVWGSFFDLLKEHSVKDEDFLRAIDFLIILLYKSAYLIDFKENKKPSFDSAIIENNKIRNFNRTRYYSPILLFDVEYHKELFSFIQNTLGDLCEMSVEAFILYNDILGWNEDFKYYSRAIENGKAWANGTGKPNTLLTHISILGYIRGEFQMVDILNRFVRTRGVSAPTGKEIDKLFEDYINPEIKRFSF